MRIKDIELFFNSNVVKKQLIDISWYEEIVDGITCRKSLINSTKECFDYDEINRCIKTSDTIYFKNGNIIFVEFKSGEIKKIDFRLKATESIISFYNFIFSNGFTETLNFPNNTFQIYFVYNRKVSPAAQFTFSQVERELSHEYKHLFSKFKVIDTENFKKIFGI